MDYENKPPFMDEPPIFTVHEGMPKETQPVRTMAPTFLLSLVEEGIFENLDGIEDLPSSTLTAMEGGTMSAAYLLRNNDAPVIVKFGTQPTAIPAEART